MAPSRPNFARSEVSSISRRIARASAALRHSQCATPPHGASTSRDDVRKTTRYRHGSAGLTALRSSAAARQRRTQRIVIAPIRRRNRPAINFS